MIVIILISDTFINFKLLESDLFQEMAIYPWHAVCCSFLGGNYIYHIYLGHG
jgi:hypothetical protein